MKRLVNSRESLPKINKEIALEACKRFIQESLLKEFEGKLSETESQVKSLMRLLYATNIERNLNMMSARWESPIEEQFLLHLAVGFCSIHPTSLFAPTLDLQQRLLQAYSLRDLVLQLEKDTDVSRFRIEKELLTDEEQKLIMQAEFLEDIWKNSVWFIPQVEIPELEGGRVDLLLWRYKWMHEKYEFDKKLVVECDGYEYHKDKNNFERDRKRDRILKANRFEVMRFAGSEICENAANCALEVIKYIENNWGF